MPLITLQAGALSLGILPELGASIAHFRDGDFELLRETPADAIAGLDGRRFAAFPLIPYSNRIRAGTFTFGGETYTLGRDAQDPRHALHGTARFQPWQVAARTAASARFSFAYQPQPADWPFAYTAWQDFTLLNDRLLVRLGLRNTHRAAAPAGIGLHPYFERHEPSWLQFSAGYVWAKDAEDIPVHTTPDAGKFDFSQPRAIQTDDLIDHAYGDWNRHATITYPALHKRIEIRASAALCNLVLYTPEGKDFFAIEPVSHRPDAVNPNHDPHDHGMAILQPGASVEGEIEIILSA